tara:strand:+ start:293 stop:763 length:471 start_codon:yes stop_codon:yes gene_type:complete
MSKKSRKRNKKILGALAAGLGAMALMKGRQGTASNNPVGGVDQIAADAVTGTVYPGSNKAKAVVAAPKTNWISPRMHGGSTDKGVSAQNKRADYAQKMRNRVTGVDAPPSILNPYSPRVIQGRLTNRGNTFKSGGRVKGAGQAKRGLGRAFSKGRK